MADQKWSEKAKMRFSGNESASIYSEWDLTVYQNFMLSGKM